MPITCFIIDDEPVAIETLADLIEKIPNLKLVGSSDDPKAGLEFLRSNPVDLLFLDIGMDEISGLDLITMIDTRVVFVTADAGLTNKALEFPNTIDYLVKPFSFQRFAVALKKIDANFPDAAPHTSVEKASFPFKTSLGIENIAFSRIKYIKAKTYYSTVFYDESSSALVNMRLNVLEAMFPSSIFARVHKSYIVNRKKIVKTSYDELELEGGINLKLSRLYKDNLTQ